MISSSMGSSCHWSPGVSNRYRRKITQNNSLILLAKLKGGQQFVRFMITVSAVFKHSLNSCMCYASAKCLLPHQKKKFRQHIMFSVLKEWGSTSQSAGGCAVMPLLQGEVVLEEIVLFLSASLALANGTGDSGHELWLGMLRLDSVTSWDPFQSTFLESIEGLHSPESGSYSRASQMASHIYVMAVASCPLISKIKRE